MPIRKRNSDPAESGSARPIQITIRSKTKVRLRQIYVVMSSRDSLTSPANITACNFASLAVAAVLTALLLLALLSAPQLARATADELPTPASYVLERAQFMLARQALAGGDTDIFELLSSSLKHYPLYRYLVYEKLRKDFRANPGKQAIAELNRFEKDFDDDALTRNLTRILQRSLADDEQWTLFLGVSKSRAAAEMRCATVRARHETGRLKQFDDASRALWISGGKRPDQCAAALTALEAQSRPGIVALWERIYSAIDNNEPDTALSLSTQLVKDDRKQVKRWVDALENSQKLLLSGKLKADNVLNRRIILDLIWRWSASELPEAIAHWSAIKKNYLFYKDKRYDMTRRLALRGAYRRLPEASEWLNAFTVKKEDLELQEWRVRTALLAQDWPAVLQRIAELPDIEQQEDHWAYWVARALEATGEVDKANVIYAELAMLQSYHGFLSADRIGAPYSLYDEPVQVASSLLDSLRIDARLVRAREYHHTGITWEARREWNDALTDFSPEQIQASIVVAGEWALPDRAIISAGRAEATRALQYRFPLLYEEHVQKAATEMNIDPTLIYGIMRRESGFIADIKSSAGAVGLMQLMPRTAKYVAGLKGDKKWRGDLTDVSTNIDFGAFYLRHVLNRYDDHLALALASYNAGPHRVKKWLPKTADLPADIWIDSIPYTETRRYVRAVLAYSMIFEWRIKGEVTRLASRLPIVAMAEPAQL